MRIKLSLVLAAVLAASAALAWSTPNPTPSPAPATALATPPKDVQPEPHDAIVDQAIAGQLERYHYGDRTLDDKQSALIFDQYLQDLDPNRSYFLQADIDSFSPFRDKLDDAIRAGNVKPGFDIYNVFQKRVDQRIQYALKLLDKQPDLTVN